MGYLDRTSVGYMQVKCLPHYSIALATRPAPPPHSVEFVLRTLTLALLQQQSSVQ